MSESWAPKTDDPYDALNEWLEIAASHDGIKEPAAMVLSTLGQEDMSSRVVLVRSVEPGQGLVFYTNYESHKGCDLATDHKVAANFYWDPLGRQICVRGHAEKIPAIESEAYWKARPRASQLSQWVSKQSQTVASREQLESEYKEAEQKFAGQDIPCPPHWGGYVIKPNFFEFWVGRSNRFHDRFSYRLVEGEWQVFRLYP